jgi:alpha/beta superfamily hydrolase
MKGMKEMKEERISFGEGGMRLEGLYAEAGGTRGAVICHPHSLMGGDMGNPVVETVAAALFRAGFSTLRFNFRGVGGSAGAFDEGRGEQANVLSAVAFLEAQGAREVLPAGYSFGAWVIAGVLSGRQLSPALFVAPPFTMFPFDLAVLRGRVGLIVCGDYDPYCPADGAGIMAAELSCRLELLAGEDHFFGQGLGRLGVCIEDYAGALRNPERKLFP